MPTAGSQTLPAQGEEGGSGPGASSSRASADANLSPEELQARRTALNQDKNRRAQRRFRQRQRVPARPGRLPCAHGLGC